MEWFRSHHGAPSDAKLALVAKATGQHRAFVSAVWWEVLDYASQQKERGSVIGLDPEIIAIKQDLDPEAVQAILSGFSKRGMTAAGRVVNWDKRQYKRDDDSTERVRKHRAKKKTGNDVTQCNADETTGNGDVTHGNAPDTDTDTEQKQNTETLDASALRQLLTFSLPEWIPQDVWDEYMVIRRKLKAVNSIRAMESIVRKLDAWRAQGHDPTAIIEKSITSSWKDVFEPKENFNANTFRSSTQTHQQPGKYSIQTAAEGIRRARLARESRGTDPA